MMNTNRLIKFFLILLIIIVNIGCDQVSKKIVRRSVNPYETIQLLSDHVTVTRVENSGAFLSAGDSLPRAVKNILLLLLPLAAMVFGFIYILSNPAISNNMLVGLCFVMGGGIGNIFDRIVHGSVTDFLHIHFGIFQTGIFNMADVSIMMGVFIILLQAFLRKKVIET
jgi:signal peptidase II